MLYDLLIVTNLPYLAAALFALTKEQYIFCILLLIVFFASTAYHSNHHEAWMGLLDRCCAVFTCLVIGSIAVARSHHVPLSMGIISGVVALCMFWDAQDGGYSNPDYCVTHSMWHILTAFTSIMFMASY